MKRFVLIAIAVWGLSADAQANPPGPLDGQSIPANFAAAKRLGVQTNHTGVGDVTSLQPIQVFSPGSELDALYLAKDTNYLYVGLAGNLLEVGNPFLIFVDNPYDYGQAELWTEGVAGPPFALQMAGRRVVVSDNGTPDDPADDTYTVVPNSGTQMPTCGSGFTGWDYALAVDTAFGSLYAHEYLLYSYPVGTASGATTGALLSDFSNFTLSATYGRWSTGTFTSGPTSFRVQSTDWGGGLYDLQPDVDATGATTMVLDFTFNPGNQADKLVVILVDADNTQRVYRFDDLATTGTYHLTRDLASFNNDNNPGTIPGLDLGHLAVFHIAGAYNHGNPGVPMDATFDNLQLLGGFHNYEARAARICLSTVPADADCNGRNDLLDAALLQRCYGMLRSPVFPMEAEQLDLNRDGLISFPDVQGLMGLIGGP